MKMETWIALATSFIAMIGTAISIYLSVQKAKTVDKIDRALAKKTSAEADKAVLEAASEVTGSTLALLPALNKRVKDLSIEVAGLRRERTQMVDEIRLRDDKILALENTSAHQAGQLIEIQRQLDRVTDWAHRLAGQLEANGINPVKLEES